MLQIAKTTEDRKSELFHRAECAWRESIGSALGVDIDRPEQYEEHAEPWLFSIPGPYAVRVQSRGMFFGLAIFDRAGRFVTNGAV